MKRFYSIALTFLVSLAIAHAASYSVSVNAEKNKSALLEAIGMNNLSQVTELTVSGTLNGYDYMAIRNKLPNLTKLDLSATTIAENDYAYYQDYVVKTNEFPSYLFYNCAISGVITSVKLPQNIESVGRYAFFGCSKLTAIQLSSNIKEIGVASFSKCVSLVSVELPSGVEVISDEAFSECTKLVSVNFPSGLLSIGRNGFARCSALKNVYFSGSLSSLGDYCFTSCASLGALHLSNRISTIGTGAFKDCIGIKELTLPGSLSSLGGQAFSGCRSIRQLYAYAAQPVPIKQDTFDSSIFSLCKLYVPKTSFDAYYWHTQWSQFATLIAQDFEYENLYISYTNQDYVLDASTGVFVGQPEIAVLEKAGIIIKDDIDQKASEVILMTDGTDSGSVIATNNLTAGSLTVQINAKKNVWYFFSLPYDASLINVRCRANKKIRTYNGYQRAESGTGWVDLANSETTLKAANGYIIQTDADGQIFITMNTPTFTGEDKTLAINLYPASDVHNAGWNFLGNPFPTYYCVGDIIGNRETGDVYSSPITVRDIVSKTYRAYNPKDDKTHHLAPFQAFFVQKPTQFNTLTFKSDLRRTYIMSESSSYLSAPRMVHEPEETDRKLLDIQLCDEQGIADETRIVYNEQMQYGYDMGVDAAKFFSNEARAELYTCEESSCAYSINERPQEGDLFLAFRSASAGSYRLHMSRAQAEVELFDRWTDAVIPLSHEDYIFATEAGTYADRFVIRTVADAIEEMSQKPEASDCYDLTGRHVDAAHSSEMIIVRQGHTAKKMIVR